jgi:aspartyl-tRNA(Asn)/glutamyl-tRNA(Gln) amidotransferase subunit C
MPLTLEQVNHIAYLARLKLTTEELELFRDQLSAILDYAARLQSLETGDIYPAARILPDLTSLRPDISQEGLTLPELLANAPDIEANQFRVPPVFD